MIKLDLHVGDARERRPGWDQAEKGCTRNARSMTEYEIVSGFGLDSARAGGGGGGPGGPRTNVSGTRSRKKIQCRPNKTVNNGPIPCGSGSAIPLRFAGCSCAPA